VGYLQRVQTVYSSITVPVTKDKSSHYLRHFFSELISGTDSTLKQFLQILLLAQKAGYNGKGYDRQQGSMGQGTSPMR